MKLTPRTPGRLRLLTLTLLLCPMLSLARTPETPDWYIGFGVGPSRANIDDDRIADDLLDSGLTATSVDKDDRDRGYKLYGGYRFAPHFAIEAGYFDLGRFGFEAETTPAGELRGQIRLRGLNLDLVGLLPVTENFSVIARGGLTYVDTADRFRGSGAVTVAERNPHERERGYKYGFGLQYELTPALALRAEAERYRVNDGVGNKGEVDLFTVGLLWRFGGNEPEPEPVPVAYVAPPPPPPPPAPIPPPLPPVLKRVVIAVDNDFEFDKIALSVSGKRTLDSFVQDLRGLTYQRITVIGNSDRIGTESYNMKLSEQRAEAVKDYLIMTGSVPADKIEATGAGQTDHRTIPSDCIGTRATVALRECLQPDRRVDVEVRGTR